MTHRCVNVLDAAKNILAVAVGAGVGHQLHKQAQTIWLGWHGVQAEKVGEVEPLPNVRQDVVLGGAGKAKTL